MEQENKPMLFTVNKTTTKQDILDYMVKDYQHLLKENPKFFSDLIVTFVEGLNEDEYNRDFIKSWLNYAIEVYPSNKNAHSLLSTYRLQEKDRLLQDLAFLPFRESDNRSQKEKTLQSYRQICQSFLQVGDDEIEQFQQDMMDFSGEKIEYTEIYKKLITILELVMKELTQLLQLLDDYETTTQRTFYNTSSMEQIQQIIVSINELTLQWEQIFLEMKSKEMKEQSALQSLQDMIGLTDVKKRIQRFYTYLKYQKNRKLAGFQGKDELSLNMILVGNPGTGKTTIARLLAKIYHELGVLPSEEVIETNRSQLVGSFVGQTEENVRMLVEKALGGVLFIDEAYSLKREGQSGNDYGQTAIDTLVSFMTSKEYGGKFSVILAGYPDEMRQFLDANTGLRSRFPQSNLFELPDYTVDELIKIGEKVAHSNDFLLTTAAKKELAYLIEQERVDRTFGNARTVHNLILAAIFNKGTFQTDIPEIFRYSVLDKEDFQVEKRNVEVEKRPMERLNELIGLKEVKEAVQTYLSFVRMQTYRRDHNLPNVPIQLHSIFTGNPGTGKTTVAKIYAALLKEYGMLKRGHLVVVGRADLIAGYVGQSAIKTKKKIHEALGGVLFIDEAYSLFRENNHDYGKEVIDTIVEEMTKHGENLVIILAGYPNEMQQLLASNPGLKSRFKKFFHFTDYTVEELISIMTLFAQRYAYQLDDDAIQYLYHELTAHPPKGNGRFAENLIHEAIQQQALRIAKDNQPFELSNVNQLTRQDIEASYLIIKKGE